jgi:hypothetical protein
MNELNLGVSIEDVDELIGSCSEPMSNEDLSDIQEENKRLHLKLKMMTVKLLQV